MPLDSQPNISRGQLWRLNSRASPQAKSRRTPSRAPAGLVAPIYEFKILVISAKHIFSESRYYFINSIAKIFFIAVFIENIQGEAYGQQINSQLFENLEPRLNTPAAQYQGSSSCYKWEDNCNMCARGWWNRISCEPKVNSGNACKSLVTDCTDVYSSYVGRLNKSCKSILIGRIFQIHESIFFQSIPDLQLKDGFTIWEFARSLLDRTPKPMELAHSSSIFSITTDGLHLLSVEEVATLSKFIPDSSLVWHALFCQ